MKQYSGFKAERSSSREKLPAGGYVCKILSAKEETYNFSSGTSHVLVLAIDVIEGDYTGIWKRDFENNTNEDKKWRGTFRLNVPKDDGSELDAWTKRAFNNAIWSIEESNPGYTWDWDETKLKGKKIGVIYRDREWEMNGNTGWTTEAGGAESIDNIRSGNFKQLKPKPLKNKPVKAEPATVDAPVDSEEELPF